MIIVVGLDNTGKTTLVNHLSDKFNIPVAKRYHTLPPRDGDDWISWVREQIESPDEALYDRFFFDELVYGPVIRKKYCCSIRQISEVCQMLVVKQPMVIVTYLPLEDLFKTFKDREQYPHLDQLNALQAKYSSLTQRPPFTLLSNLWFFNYITDPDKQYVSQAVENYINNKPLGGTNYGQRKRF